MSAAFLRPGDADVTLAQRSVFNAIAWFVAEHGGEAYPKQATIAAMVGCCRETVCRAVKRLKALGLMDVKGCTRAVGGGRRWRMCCLYSLGFAARKLMGDGMSQFKQVQINKQEKSASALERHMAAVLSRSEVAAPVLGIEGFRLRQAENRLRLRLGK